MVPPELRRAQEAFSAVVEERVVDGVGTTGDEEADGHEWEGGPVAKAVLAAGRMRKLEVEIRKLRKGVRKLEKRTGEAA